MRYRRQRFNLRHAATVAAWRSASARSVGAGFAIGGDLLLASSIMIAGVIAWAPLAGMDAARETMARRRVWRAALAALERSEGPVWAQHARRGAGVPAPGWLSVRSGAPHLDW